MENKNLEELTIKANRISSGKIDAKDLSQIKRVGTGSFYIFEFFDKQGSINGRTYDFEYAREEQKIVLKVLELMNKEGIYPQSFEMKYTLPREEK